jgi:hypothetical protein
MGDAEPRFDQPGNQKSVRLLTQDETDAGITRTATRVVRLNGFRDRANPSGLRRRFDHIVEERNSDVASILPSRSSTTTRYVPRSVMPQGIELGLLPWC